MKDAEELPKGLALEEEELDEGDKEQEKEVQHNIPPPVSFLKLFSTADKLDVVLLFFGTLGAMGNGVCWPVFAILFGDFTDAFGTFSGSVDFMDDVRYIALTFVYLAIGAAAGSALQSACFMWAGNRQAARLRTMYLTSALRQNIGYFDTTANSGNMLEGLNASSAEVQAAISEKCAHFIQHMTTFFSGLIIALAIGWDIALVLIGMMPFVALGGAILAKVTSVMSGRMSEALSSASSYAQQVLSQIRTVAAYNGETRSWKTYLKELEMPIQVGKRQSVYTGFALGLVQLFMFCTFAVAFYYGAWRVSTEHYTGGQVLQVCLAALMGGISLGQAAPVVSNFSKGRSAAAQLFAVINRVPEIDPEDEGGLKLDKVEGSVELQHVAFAYPVRPDCLVFKDFSLFVPQGTTVALAGSSGSGKSTVVGLVERFYDPSAGRVLLDGHDIREMNLKWLRMHVGLVSQEPTLFATTILENIRMGRPGASQEEVETAAMSANAHRFISALPAGYTTQVGERGLQLSGGQRQRIAIARAILKNPKVLLLDEATSALDTKSERIVQSALNKMIVGRTTIVVAHRLSTIKDANQIAVVKEGSVAEIGSHNELIQRPEGLYASLVRLQADAKKQDSEASTGAVPAEGSSAAGGGEEEDEDAEEEPEIMEPQASLDSQTGSVEKSDDSNTSDVPLNSLSGPVPMKVNPLAQDTPGGKVGSFRKMSQELSKQGSANAAIDIVIPPSSHKARNIKGRWRAHKERQAAKKEEAAKQEEEADVSFSRLASMAKPEWHYGLIGILSSAGAGAVQPLFAFTLASFIIVFFKPIDEVLGEASLWSWILFVLGMGMLICVSIQQWSFGFMGQALNSRVRSMMLKNMLAQEIGWFDRDENTSGALSAKLSTDANYVRGAVGDTLGLLAQNASTLATGYIIGFVFNWRMALLVTGALPFMLFGAIIYYKTITGMESGSTKLFGSANTAVSDAFSSIRTVQAYNLQSQMVALYKSLVADANAKMKKQSFITGALTGYSNFSIYGTYGLVIWFGGLDLDAGRTDFEGMLKAFLAILMAAIGIAQAQIGFPDVGKAKSAVRRIFPIIDRKSQIDASSPEGARETIDGKTTLAGQIELKDVTFAYPARPSVIVFRNFSLHIPAGHTVALVGESGSGKSTIVGLCLRFYDPQHGVVEIDGRDVRQYNIGWLRSQIGIVSQEPLLFSASVLENIRYGKADAGIEEVEAAARTANAHDFITNLPEGYNTQVGERGVQMSGGMKQRIAIARAIVRNPRILLLDEATSALDMHSEKLVQQALDVAMVGRTSVVVAHRLSTIRNANKIALVHQGTILEQGSHEELMALPNGGYAGLVAAQTGVKAEK